MAIAPDQERDALLVVEADQLLDVELFAPVLDLQCVHVFGEDHLVRLFHAKAADVSRSLLSGRFLVPDENGIQAYVSQDFGEFALGKCMVSCVIVPWIAFVVAK